MSYNGNLRGLVAKFSCIVAFPAASSRDAVAVSGYHFDIRIDLNLQLSKGRSWTYSLQTLCLFFSGTARRAFPRNLDVFSHYSLFLIFQKRSKRSKPALRAQTGT